MFHSVGNLRSSTERDTGSGKPHVWLHFFPFVLSPWENKKVFQHRQKAQVYETHIFFYLHPGAEGGRKAAFSNLWGEKSLLKTLWKQGQSSACCSFNSKAVLGFSGQTLCFCLNRINLTQLVIQQRWINWNFFWNVVLKWIYWCFKNDMTKEMSSLLDPSDTGPLLWAGCSRLLPCGLQMEPQVALALAPSQQRSEILWLWMRARNPRWNCTSLVLLMISGRVASLFADVVVEKGGSWGWGGGGVLLLVVWDCGKRMTLRTAAPHFEVVQSLIQSQVFPLLWFMFDVLGT